MNNNDKNQEEISKRAQEELQRFVINHDMISHEHLISHYDNENNPEEKIEILTKESKIIRINHEGQTFYPAFQFFTDNSNIIFQVNQLLNALENPWTVSDWWFRPNVNSWIPPFVMLSSDPQEVVNLAALQSEQNL